MMNSVFALILPLLAATTPADGFGLRSSAGSGRRISKSSPLVDDALSAYPFIIKSDAEKSALAGNFNEMARLFGDEEALSMVQIMPATLKFKKENFQPCLDSWAEQFTLEGAQAMVRRNPGLLGVPPESTKDAQPSMAFSYVVAAIRPSLPKVIGFIGLLLLAGRQYQESGGVPY